MTVSLKDSKDDSNSKNTKKSKSKDKNELRKSVSYDWDVQESMTEKEEKNYNKC